MGTLIIVFIAVGLLVVFIYALCRISTLSEDRAAAMWMDELHRREKERDE